MIKIKVRIPKEDAEKAFQTLWDDEKFKWVTTELLKDLTSQMSDEIKQVQTELESKLEQAKIRRKFVEALFKINTIGTINVDLLEKLREMTMVFEDKIEFFEDYISYTITIVNATDLTDYRRLNLNETQQIEKSLPWSMRAALKAQGGLRAFMEKIFKSQQKIAEILKEELQAQFPHAEIKIAVNRSLKEDN